MRPHLIYTLGLPDCSEDVRQVFRPFIQSAGMKHFIANDFLDPTPNAQDLQAAECVLEGNGLLIWIFEENGSLNLSRMASAIDRPIRVSCTMEIPSCGDYEGVVSWFTHHPDGTVSDELEMQFDHDSDEMVVKTIHRVPGQAAYAA